MDNDGRCNGYVTATLAMEHGGNGDDTTMSNGCHCGMLAHYSRASVHLELLSFGYKYGAPPHRSWDSFTYARPLPPLDVHDLNRAPGHVLKFNSLLYLVRRSLLNPPRGHANDDHRRDCNGNCNNDDIYGDLVDQLDVVCGLLLLLLKACKSLFLHKRNGFWVLLHGLFGFF